MAGKDYFVSQRNPQGCLPVNKMYYTVTYLLTYLLTYSMEQSPS